MRVHGIVRVRIAVILTISDVLQTTTKKDLSSTDMKQAVAEFSRLPSHGPVTCLIVMSHGDQRGDIVDDARSTCTVQSLLHALDSPELSSTYKVSESQF